MKKCFRYLFLVPLIAVLAACCPDEPVTPDDETSRTVLAYIVGSSNLRSSLEGNIADMVTGMAGRSGNLLVYYDPDNGTPNLWKIDPVAGKILVEAYEEENSASKEVLERVVNRVLGDPAYRADSYGVLFLGHATGWILAPGTSGLGARKYRAPLLERNPDAPFMTRSYGSDGGAEMNIADLASALPNGRQFDFILFDACLMSGIEPLYDLRNKAKYIVASPAEVMAHGYPYDKAVPVMFESGEITAQRLSRMADTFMTFYRAYSYPSALTTVVNAEKIDALAKSTWEILRYISYTGTTLNLSSIQAFENMPNHVFFDLDRYMLAAVGGSNTLYANGFVPALQNAVEYCDYTPRLYTGYGSASGYVYRSVDYCCGITSFIPQSRPDYLPDYLQTTYMKDYNTWLSTL